MFAAPLILHLIMNPLKMLRVDTNDLPWMGGFPIQLIAVGIIALGLGVIHYSHKNVLHPGIPVIGMEDTGWFKYEKARQNYIMNGKALVESGVKQVGETANWRHMHSYTNRYKRSYLDPFKSLLGEEPR